MKKKETIHYTVEREFLSKISVEEMLIRIIKAHLIIKEKNSNLV